MNRVLVLAAGFVGLAFSSAVAQSDKTQVRGMLLTTLNGAYEYTSGGVPLRGYIVEAASVSQAKAADSVEFRVCNTGKVLQVKRKLLRDSPPCRTPPKSMWSAWIIKQDKLVTQDPGGAFESFGINELPGHLQVLMHSPDKSGEIRAFSFPSTGGDTVFGVITKPNG
jgi:hypothetical protein